MRESWTDDRMDDLNAKVDRLDADVRGLRVEMKTEFAAAREKQADERFNASMRRFDTMQTLLNWLCGGAWAALLGFIATQI